MTRRAYSPRRSTVDLVAAILAVDGVARVHTIAPSRGPSGTRPTRLRVTLDGRHGNGRPVYTDFTLAEARAWLAADTALQAGAAEPLTLGEAAASLGLDASTLRRQVGAGVLQARKVGPLWLVAPAEVERYRREHLGRHGNRR